MAKHFFSLENPALAQEYKAFMAEYLALNHIEEAKESETPPITYRITRHSVIKQLGTLPSKYGKYLMDRHPQVLVEVSSTYFSMVQPYNQICYQQF